MIVTVNESVFMEQGAQLELLALIQLCREEGRHVLLSDPGSGRSSVIGAWMKRLHDHDPALAEDIERILERGPRAALRAGAGACSVRVEARGAPDWKRRVLDLSTALRLLRMSLRLVVENRRNDGAFVRRVAPPRLRERLDQALERGWIEFAHGGGMEEMIALLEEVATTPHVLERARLWIMFDGDGRAPRQCSEQSNKLRGLCEACTDPWPLNPQQLKRRSMENYLPIQSLRRWVDEGGSGTEKARRRALVDAFERRDPEVRHHLDMKDLFGRKIGELFHEKDGHLMQDEWLQREFPERHALIESIFERI